MSDHGKSDESVPDEAPAAHPADEDDDAKTKEEQDAAVDEASEQSMDGSDPPAW